MGNGWRLLKQGAYVLALAFLLAGVIRPVVRRPASGIEYVVIFDVSLSMATEDYSEDGLPRSRLEAAKGRFRRIYPELPPQSRITIAGSAGSTAQIFLLSHPVSDPEAIEAALDVLEWDNVWDVGSRVDRVLVDLVQQSRGSRLFSVVGRRPLLTPPYNVFFFTDGGGDDVAHAISTYAATWLRGNARITFVGVGQPRPSPVPEFRRAPTRDCLRDDLGECLTSALNARNLEALAEHLDARYERLDDPGRLARLFLDDPLTGARTEVEREIGWLFSLGSLAFFLLWALL